METLKLSYVSKIMQRVLIDCCYQAMYTKAKKHELAAEYDRAFEAYLKAASLFLHLNRNTPDAKHKANAAQALERAEKIKSLKTSSRSLAVDWFSDGKDIPTFVSTERLIPPPSGHFSLLQKSKSMSWRRGNLSMD